MNSNTPATKEAQKYYKIISDHSIYFGNDFNGYWRLALGKLPLGENVGVDGHPAIVINKLLLIESYVNQQISKKKDRDKKK